MSTATALPWTAADAAAWIDTLKEGDMVAVHEWGRGAIHTLPVIRKTPTGRVVLQGGATFTKDGRIFGSTAVRTIRPVAGIDRQHSAEARTRGVLVRGSWQGAGDLREA